MFDLIFTASIFIPVTNIFTYFVMGRIEDINWLSIKLTVIHTFSVLVSSVLFFHHPELPINIFKIIIIILSALILFINLIICLIKS